ncbi:MAG: hypothetical protein ACRCZB_05045 [Bacteroidales bacterium]
MEDKQSKRFIHNVPIVASLLDNKQVRGNFVETEKSGTIIKKVFFKTYDSRKELCIRNLSTEFYDLYSSLANETNDYLEFLLEQAKLEFPEWVKINGRHSCLEAPAYTISEIYGEWKSMKSSFGDFRMASMLGFFTSGKPQEAKLNPIRSLRVL